MDKRIKTSKRCFVVGPLGDDDSEDRIHADWLLEEIIQPVFAQDFKDYIVDRADRISVPGRIDAQVISALLEADLVIADLTTLNPNAFYEIGIRHMTQKPVIHVHLEGQRIPFDVASFRSIKFSRARPRDLRAARAELKKAVAAANDPDHEVDNPVTYARGKIHFAEGATPPERLLQDQIDDLRLRINGMAHSHSNPMNSISKRLHETEANNLRIIVHTEKGKVREAERELEFILDIILENHHIERLNHETLVISSPVNESIIRNIEEIIKEIHKSNFVKDVKATIT